MNPCAIANFSPDVLAPSYIRKAHANYEWVAINTGEKYLIDLSGKRNLYIKCAECGCEITASGRCPDCGNGDFYVEELMERRLVECPDLRVRISDAGFLRIEIPDAVKKSSVIKYTFDGSQPCHTSPEWNRPIKVPPYTAKVSVCLFGKGTRSQIVTVNCPHTLQPTCEEVKSFSCVYCHRPVIASGDEVRCDFCYKSYHRVNGQWYEGKLKRTVACGVCFHTICTTSSAFTCSKCGTKHQFDSGTKQWICMGIPHKCELCGASITLFKSITKCSNCGAEYDISESGSIRYNGYADLICICGKAFRATSTSLSECGHCHRKYEFSKGIWNEKIEKKEKGSGCVRLIIIIILLLLAWAIS